ncbi:hypothetical protein Aduo_012821 [Ancylostoma duodenale]
MTMRLVASTFNTSHVVLLCEKMLRFTVRMASSACVAVTMFDVVGHPAVVTGASMAPTLEGSDARWWHRDLVWLTPWGTHKPRVGDVITFV